MTEIRNGEYRLTTEPGVSMVYKGEERLGHFWKDPLSGGYAAFVSGRATPVARPKSESGCIRKITGGAWDGTEEKD